MDFAQRPGVARPFGLGLARHQADREEGRAAEAAEAGRSGCRMTTRLISEIEIGKRHRRDPRNIEGLARSIEAVGLFHPIVVDHSNRLVAGERRIKAFELLGRTKIPVTVVDLAEIVRGEFVENTEREDFTLSEAVAIKRSVEPLIRAEAEARMLAGKGADGSGGRSRKAKPYANLAQGFGGNTRDLVARRTGKGRTSLAKAEAIVAAAEAEPQRFGRLVEYMDKTGSVDRAFKQLKIERAKARHAKLIEPGCMVGDLAALAASGYRAALISADPAWPYATWGGPSSKIHSASDNHYNTNSLEEIMKLPVAALAADDCALLLWCTWPHVAIGTHVRVIEAWGFKPSTLGFDWIKQTADGGGLHTGMGYYTRSNGEPCLLATKGSPLRLASDVHSVVMAPVGGHSAKPEEVRRRAERLFPGPYLELYGRKSVAGWTVWGNEIPRDGFGVAATPAPR